MSTQSNAIPEAFESSKVAPAVEWRNQFFWSVRREVWENRSIYIAPLGVAAVFLLGFLITVARLPREVRAAQSLDSIRYRAAIAMPYDFAGGMMMLVAILVSVFYCIDALHGERRDRSILFWKSMPVSDWTTLLAKASIPVIVIPAFACAVAIALQWIMLLVSSLVLLANGLSVGRFWTELSFVPMSLLLIYHILTAHALWPAPVYGWLLLVSGWARRAVLLWAALPVVAIGIVEVLVFRTWHFARLVGMRLIGATPATIMADHQMFPTNPMTHIMPGQFLISPGLWIGLLVMAAFLAAAVRVRRVRGPV